MSPRKKAPGTSTGRKGTSMKSLLFAPRGILYSLFLALAALFSPWTPCSWADPVQMEAADTSAASSPASGTNSTGINYRPVQMTNPPLHFSERESPFSALPSAGWAAPYQTTANQKLIEVLWQATEKAGSLAKNVSQTVGGYVKERQMELKQQELVHRFYEQLDQILMPMRLSQADYSELVHKVEQVYIEDAESGAFKLDTVTFRDLPVLARTEYAEMALTRVQNGPVETFFPNGTVKARWNFKNGRADGVVTTYYEDGEIRFMDHYRDGMKIHRKKFDKEGRLEFEQAYDYTVPQVPVVSAPVPQAPAVEETRPAAPVAVSAPAVPVSPEPSQLQEPVPEAPEHPL